MTSRDYPDLSEIFARREIGRAERARMPFEEKLKVMDKLRATADEFKVLRDRRARDQERNG